MKIKNLFATSLFCLISIFSFAQNSAIKGGFDFRTSDMGFAPGAKANIEFKMAEQWSIAANVGFTVANQDPDRGDSYSTAYRGTSTNIISEVRFYVNEVFDGLYFNTRLGVRLMKSTYTSTDTFNGITDTDIYEDNEVSGLFGVGMGYSISVSERVIIDLHAAINGDSWSDVPVMFDGGVTVGYKF